MIYAILFTVLVACGACITAIVYAVGRHLPGEIVAYVRRRTPIKKKNKKCPACASYKTVGAFDFAGSPRTRSLITRAERLGLSAFIGFLLFVYFLMQAEHLAPWGLPERSLFYNLLGESGYLYVSEVMRTIDVRSLTYLAAWILIPAVIMFFLCARLRLSREMIPISERWKCVACGFRWEEEPNKAPEPTSGTVTPPAEPGVAPVPPVAHL
jgi:hypothetical protein